MSWHIGMLPPETSDLGAIAHGPAVLARSPGLQVGLRTIIAYKGGLEIAVVVVATGAHADVPNASTGRRPRSTRSPDARTPNRSSGWPSGSVPPMTRPSNPFPAAAPLQGRSPACSGANSCTPRLNFRAPPFCDISSPGHRSGFPPPQSNSHSLTRMICVATSSPCRTKPVIRGCRVPSGRGCPEVTATEGRAVRLRPGSVQPQNPRCPMRGSPGGTCGRPARGRAAEVRG
ncbi:hypothetical protein MLGJGCBP_00026 [Rhodococcus sp. T7]|nr:hypothetical protein MLGJGCBP_09057 [Rhodococcus sp. T7]KAF0966831.1 hypothetical protein MLGJGCBP_00026 [Rhodococcus sp. T7]